MSEDNYTEKIQLQENDFLVAEDRVRDLNVLLEDLIIMRGAEFIRQLKEITNHPSFYPVKDETNIYITGGEKGEDYNNLLNAARKAVEHGYRVFILPNPKDIRTADYIFERKGVFKMYDLKTIQGKASVLNRMIESIGQTNHVLLNMTTNYNARLMASDLKAYFEMNRDAVEVLIFKSNKVISVKKGFATSCSFNRLFRKLYEK